MHSNLVGDRICIINGIHTTMNNVNMHMFKIYMRSAVCIIFGVLTNEIVPCT